MHAGRSREPACDPKPRSPCAGSPLYPVFSGLPSTGFWLGGGTRPLNVPYLGWVVVAPVAAGTTLEARVYHPATSGVPPLATSSLAVRVTTIVPGAEGDFFVLQILGNLGGFQARMVKRADQGDAWTQASLPVDFPYDLSTWPAWAATGTAVLYTVPKPARCGTRCDAAVPVALCAVQGADAEPVGAVIRPEDVVTLPEPADPPTYVCIATPQQWTPSWPQYWTVGRYGWQNLSPVLSSADNIWEVIEQLQDQMVDPNTMGGCAPGPGSLAIRAVTPYDSVANPAASGSMTFVVCAPLPARCRLQIIGKGVASTGGPMTMTLFWQPPPGGLPVGTDVSVYGVCAARTPSVTLGSFFRAPTLFPSGVASIVSMGTWWVGAVSSPVIALALMAGTQSEEPWGAYASTPLVSRCHLWPTTPAEVPRSVVRTSGLVGAPLCIKINTSELTPRACSDPVLEVGELPACLGRDHA